MNLADSPNTLVSQDKSQQAVTNYEQSFLTSANLSAVTEIIAHKTMDEDRPLEIIEDVKFTEQRHRVKSALESADFKHDLESVLEAKADNTRRSSFIANQSIPLTDIHVCGRIIASQIPINDLRMHSVVGGGDLVLSRNERQLRCQLASLCRLIYLHGWSSGIHGNASVKLDAQLEHFLVNPFGILFNELTASALIKVDNTGHVLKQSDFKGFCHNQPAFTLHSALYCIRPDLRCIVHLHSDAATVISSLKEGMLPISYEVLRIGGISYHNFDGIVEERLIRQLLCNDLGPFNKILMLRNHGILVCASSVEEAWSLTSNVMRACEIQCRAMSAVGGRTEALVLPSEDTQKRMVEESRIVSASEGGNSSASTEKHWKTEDLEFEAALRMLDNAGMRTGHSYKFPYDLKGQMNEHSSYDCTLPANQSSLVYTDHNLNRNVSKNQELNRTSSSSQKAGWLISPNCYVRQKTSGTIHSTDKAQILQASLSSCSRWSADSKLGFSTPIKISQHSFSPVGVNSSELKSKHEQMKENRVIGKKSAGPLTNVCRNIEKYDSSLPSVVSSVALSQRKTDSTIACEDNSFPNVTSIDVSPSATIDRKVLVGAASRGVVKRNHQDDCDIYKTQYSRNPFNISDNPLAVDDEVNEDDKEGDCGSQNRNPLHYDLPSDNLNVDEDTLIGGVQASSIPSETLTSKNSRRKRKSREKKVLGAALDQNKANRQTHQEFSDQNILPTEESQRKQNAPASSQFCKLGNAEEVSSILPEHDNDALISGNTSPHNIAASQDCSLAERKKSSFRTPSFLRRTKKRSQSTTHSTKRGCI